MITGELKNKIDSLWDIFAAGGLVNPLEVIEQITYLMFIHDLDDSDNKREKESAVLGLPYQSIFTNEVEIGGRSIDGAQLKWSVFHDFPADRMYSVMQEWVFPFIKSLHTDKDSAYSKYMDDAIFKLPTPLLLSKVVDALDEIYALMNEMQTADVRGDVYEYLLSKIAQSGLNGQFRTPRHIIRMMVGTGCSCQPCAARSAGDLHDLFVFLIIPFLTGQLLQLMDSIPELLTDISHLGIGYLVIRVKRNIDHDQRNVQLYSQVLIPFDHTVTDIVAAKQEIRLGHILLRRILYLAVGQADTGICTDIVGITVCFTDLTHTLAATSGCDTGCLVLRITDVKA